jgi:hypothetical protein
MKISPTPLLLVELGMVGSRCCSPCVLKEQSIFTQEGMYRNNRQLQK